jgi:Spy/CpxP family protein refolding chaperone
MNISAKNMIRFTALACALMAGPAIAQMAGPGHQDGVGNANNGQQLRLFYELNLDEAQMAEVQAIWQAAQTLREEERARARANNDAIRMETQDAVMAVLDEAQQARFLELQQLRAESWGYGARGQGHGMSGGQGPGMGLGTGAPYDGDCPNPDCPNPDCPNSDIPDGDG